MYLGFQLINKTYISLKLTKNLKSKDHDIYPLLLILLTIVLHNNKKWFNQL